MVGTFEWAEILSKCKEDQANGYMLLNFPYSVLELYLILSDNPDMDLCSAM